MRGQRQSRIYTDYLVRCRTEGSDDSADSTNYGQACRLTRLFYRSARSLTVDQTSAFWDGYDRGYFKVVRPQVAISGGPHGRFRIVSAIMMTRIRGVLSIAFMQKYYPKEYLT